MIQSGVLDRGLFDTINNLKWIDKTSSLLISGDLESIAKVEDLLHKFDVPDKGAASSSIETIESTNFLIYKLQYHQGGEIQSALKKIAADLQQPGSTASQNLLNTINSLQWIKITNSLLASGKQETLTKLKTLIENLDIPLRQVFIEVLVIQTTVDNSQNIGVQWGGKAQYLNKFGTGFNNIPTANPNSSTPGSPLVFLPNLGQISNTRFPNAVTDLPLGTAPFPGFDLGVIGDIIMNKGKSFLSLGALINALQQDGDSTIVMNPKIVAQDSNNSTIFVGQNIPFNSSIVTNSTANTLQTANIEYRDVGVNLSITPTIGTGNIITLDISNDISQQVSQSITISSSQGSIAGLQTTHTSMSTRVHIPDKHFLVLSGMVQDSTSHFKSSVPCLGGLPLIGAAFSNNERSRDKNNIVIFVRPQIINSTAEFDTITEHQEDVYRESAFLPSVQEAFDAGIDIVKQPLEETD